MRVPPKITSIISIAALLFFLPFLLLVSYETVQLISRAAGTVANIAIDAGTNLEPIKTDFYHAFAQGGEESTDMLAPIAGELRVLRPKLIRLDHIYDHYDVVGRNGDSLTFNFQKLDAAIDTILAVGAKPLLALSYMPSVIARDGNITNPPNNWDEWALVVQRTVEHFSGRGGKNLGGVYYEVWNEPDLEQFGKWKYGGNDKNYLTLYRYAAAGAARAAGVNAFSLGGPGTTGLYKSWILALVQSGLRIDFLSWHSYFPRPEQYATDEKNLITWLLPYPQYVLLPKFITEFGFTGNKDTRYGTTYAAAYTAAAIRQMISGGPTYAFSFQPKDGPNQAEGNGWGLVTHEDNGKKPKPRYYIYNFLNAMAGTRVDLKGEGTWVTGFATRREGVLRIMLVNFDASGAHSENVPITIANLPPGTYSWRERFLLGRDTTFTETVTDQPLAKTLYMPAQSVAIVEISKK